MPDASQPQMTTFSPGPDTARQFRHALGSYATGVTIITCRTPEGPLGITANSFSSLSLDPPLVLWSPARSSRRFQAFEAAEHFAIHIVAADQHDLCGSFVKDGSDFSAADFSESQSGVPLLNGCLARFECTRHAVHDGGDHAIIVGKVTAITVNDGDPLVFAKGTYGRFTHKL